MKTISIVGVGHNTPVYIDLAESCGFQVDALYHYNSELDGKQIFGIPVVGTHEDLFLRGCLEGRLFAVSIGDNRIRSYVSNSIRSRGGVVPTIIHPSATVSPRSFLGDGVVVQPGAVVQANSKIGNDTVISYFAGVTHDAEIGHGCYIANNAVVGAYVTLENMVQVGMGAHIVSGKVKKIGTHSIIGAGSVVIRDVRPNATVAGNPAKIISEHV